MRLREVVGDDPDAPRRDSGRAALERSQSKTSGQSTTARSKFSGITSNDLRADKRMVAAPKNRLTSVSTDNINPGEVALVQQRSISAPRSSYDLRQDLKPRPVTYRQVFR